MNYNKHIPYVTIIMFLIHTIYEYNNEKYVLEYNLNECETKLKRSETITGLLLLFFYHIAIILFFIIFCYCIITLITKKYTIVSLI